MLPTAEDREVEVNVDHLLDTLNNRVFEDKLACVREYVSNAHDAWQGYAAGRPGVRDADARIHVRAEPDALTFADNGCGMTRERVIHGFAAIAGHRVNEHSQGRTIGRFGLGVLSAFMLADRIEMETRSEDEPHGWRLDWRRGSRRYTLAPLARADRGTTVRLRLLPDMAMYGSEREVAKYVAHTFPLLPVPVRVGRGDGRVANPHAAWVGAALAGRAEALLTGREHRDLLRDASPVRNEVVAGYAGRVSDSAVLYLGIPTKKFEPFGGGHNVSFFAHGVRVLDQPREFLEPGLRFFTALLNSEELKVKMSRDGIITDEAFTALRGEVRHHALRFLELLAASRPEVIGDVLRTHSVALAAEALEDPRLLAVLRDHYPFELVNSRGVRWGELTRLARPPGPGQGRTVFYLSDPHGLGQITPVLNRGHQVVFAGPTDLPLLERLAEDGGVDGVRLKDALDPEPEPPPSPDVQSLIARLTPFLFRQGVLDVELLRNPQRDAPAATFRVRHVAAGGRRGVLQGRGDGAEDNRMEIAVEALQLNLAHPLLEELVARAEDLREDALGRAAEVLFEVATLHSPFEGVRHRITPRVCGRLIDALLRELKAFAAPEGGVHAQCFVAMPYRPEFEAVWAGLRAVLEADPYHWTLVRADHDVSGVGLLNNLMTHLDASTRFIAELSLDGSKFNENVMLELGMMLQKRKQGTLILADRETAAALPIDLRGEVLAVYPRELRQRPAEFAAWFAQTIPAHKFFSNVRGVPRPRRGQ